MKKFLIAAMFVLMGYTASQAGGFETPGLTPNLGPTPSEPWTGFSAGISVATDAAELKSGAVPFISSDSYIGGVHLGYDKQIGRFVFGVRGEYNWVLENSGYDVDSAWDVTGRGGVLLGSRSLLYLLGGYRETLNGSGIPNAEGFYYGAGIEHSFGKIHGSLEAHRFTDDDIISGIDLDTTRIRGALSYRF